MRESPNERSVEIAKAQKGSDILYFSGCWPVFDACNFCGVHACHPLFKDYPQVIDRLSMESALLRFEVQIVILCNRKNVFNGRYMIRKGSGCSDSNIVHVDSNDRSSDGVLCDDIFVNLIHHRLEGRWRVTEAKEHDCGLEESILCFECRLMFVSFFDSDVVISPTHIEFGEDRGSAEICDKV